MKRYVDCAVAMQRAGNTYSKLWMWDVEAVGSWWRHQMETFYLQLAICVTRSFHREAWDLRRYRAHYDVIVI